ncbi:hypothetical protein [Microbacterium sp. zg-YB36]|uniref:hypothetical protein n=1 Tax=Microbacterium sp. zg-YB36 TaxID=2969407 RepID=UPI00214C14A2|nr:hypothetical protein [Microbacterium sp. zg-YB36]MDL5352328.1 hypothetical protein [Microbacterium sp. zg-YB36]
MNAHDDMTDADARTGRIRRFLLGTLTFQGLPVLGGAFPLATIVAITLIPVRPVAKRPIFAKTLPFLAVLCVAALLGSSLLQQRAIPQESISYLGATALLLWVGIGTASGARGASEILLWTSVGTGAYWLAVGNDLTRAGLDYLWKFGIAFQAVVITLWIVSRHVKNYRAASVAVLVLGTLVSLFAGYRSAALIALAAALITVVKGTDRRLGPMRLTFVIAGGVVAYWLLTASIDAGLFGVELQIKTLAQSGSGVLGGRTELALSAAAIGAAPAFGWGSLQAVNAETIGRAQRIAEHFGLDPSVYLPIWIRPNGALSVHSMLFQAWIEGGLIAAVFPLALVGLLIWSVLASRGRWSALTVFASLATTWDLLFSPWDFGRSALIAASCALAVWSIVSAGRSDTTGFRTTPSLQQRSRLGHHIEH